MTPNSSDDLIEIGMQQWFAATDRYDRRAELRQQVDSVKHLFRWHRWGRTIKFVAVSAGEIAATYRIRRLIETIFCLNRMRFIGNLLTERTNPVLQATRVTDLSGCKVSQPSPD